MPQQQLKVMISSTALDLPEHRKEALDACLRQGMFPIMMEHLPASDAEAISASLKMVDDADVYVLILAHRYGYVPKGHSVSVTEMEYDRAVERKIRRAVFVVDKTQSLADFTIEDIDTGENAAKLKALKERCEKENIVNFFKSPADLRAHLINSLSQHREADLTTFHYVSDIPLLPEPFIAHPYTLLQTRTLVGRQAELKLLTDWITGKPLPGDVPGESVPIMSVVAIGGMGKSAMTWKWFNDIAPQEMNSLAGRMWWSFYESDATFENFVTRALAYVTKRPLDAVRQIPGAACEAQLLAALNRDPFLLVLDGLERILIAYARMDASRLDDNQLSKERSLRKTTDPRVGNFFKKLAQVKNSRILISSRLYPAELETDGGDPIPGCFKYNINGLTDEDAVELWRGFGVTGSRDELVPIFSTFGKHPLLIQALAGEVKRYHRAPGDFAEWRKAAPLFDPSKFPKLQDAMVHVLEFALRGLNEQAVRVLHTIAAFRMPTAYDTLAAVLTGVDKPCRDEPELDQVMSALEDRGLLGWDKRANRYDLHPIVRGVVWSHLGQDTRQGVYASLRAHFEPLPMIDDWHVVNSLDELTSAIELYNILIGLGYYEDAASVFHNRLSDALMYRVSASRQSAELLEMLFQDGLDHLPSIASVEWQTYVLHVLAQAYQLNGQAGKAVPFYHRAIENSGHDLHWRTSPILGSLSETLRVSGALRNSQSTAYRSLVISRESSSRSDEAYCLAITGLLLATCGDDFRSASALNRSLRLSAKTDAYPNYDDQAERSLLFGRFKETQQWANRAASASKQNRFDRGLIRATRLQGEAAVGLNDFTVAQERLQHALSRARMVNLVEEEIPALTALAELWRRLEDFKSARDLLEDAWESAERGPYPLFHADAFNVLAQIERDEGNSEAAIEAATKAYRLAWCDGPPFAYHWGLEKAKKHLEELGASEPEMPPFDESKFEPMPEVEIDPDDEFVGDSSEGLEDSISSRE